MPFSQIIGHKKQIEYLQKVLKNGQFAHAYLFSGPRHLGKSTVARAFLQELSRGSLEQNPNAVVLSDSETIAVEEIRRLRERLALSSFGSGRKLSLIDNADQMTPAAQNALLKTLEEPRGNTIIILVAHQQDRLLETIRSRCVHIRFHPLKGDPFPGRTMLLQDDEHRERHEAMTSEAHAFINGTLWQRIAMIERWVKAKQDPPLIQLEDVLHERLLTDGVRPLQALTQLRADLSRNSNTQLALQEFARSI